MECSQRVRILPSVHARSLRQIRTGVRASRRV